MSELVNTVQAHIMRGGRVESQTDQMAVVVYGKQPNHILHVLLCVITVGLWIPVWLILYSTQRERRYVITVDSNGGVHEREHKQAISAYDKWREKRN